MKLVVWNGMIWEPGFSLLTWWERTAIVKLRERERAREGGGGGGARFSQCERVCRWGCQWCGERRGGRRGAAETESLLSDFVSHSEESLPHGVRIRKQEEQEQIAGKLQVRNVLFYERKCLFCLTTIDALYVLKFHFFFIICLKMMLDLKNRTEDVTL